MFCKDYVYRIHGVTLWTPVYLAGSSGASNVCILVRETAELPSMLRREQNLFLLRGFNGKSQERVRDFS